MPRLFRHFLFPALVLLVGLGAGRAQADIAEVVDGEGNRMTFEYQGDKLRISIQGEDSYLIQRDGTVYVVARANGNTLVIDLRQAMAMFGDLARSAVPDLAAARVESLQPTGRLETVAGITGEVHILSFTDHEGRRDQAELALSPDPRAVGFRDAMYRMALNMSDMLDQRDATDRLQAELGAMELGVLRYGEDMRVTAISATRVEDARFVLPAAPTDLSALGALFGGGNRQQGTGDGESGGTLENLGKEAGKALGRMFGR